ncbi:hypothetical protein QR680_019069 [Steinernema hermaphroditum]|uniref:Metalloendopeptidase n=1 Tax=Steinernema hermaphroditum TaxID=289476 RepID=A0AA39HJU3_9BILA|nr:hypothetical protein QR680_019069 [Steinernema hermaphroditum]
MWILPVLLALSASSSLSLPLEKGNVSSTTFNRSKRQAFQGAGIWSDGLLYYFDTVLPLTEEVKQGVRNGMAFWEKHTCVRFHEVADPSNPPSWPIVKILDNGPICLTSGIGRWSKKEQIISMGPRCTSLHSSTHELGHALGFMHEQQRWDRDTRIRIDKSNMIPAADIEYETYDKSVNNNYGKPYDVGSVMQYPPYSYAIDKTKPVMIALDPDYQYAIGKAWKPSFGDIYEMNMLYSCYDGWQTLESKKEVGNGKFPKGNLADPFECTWHVTAPEGRKIEYMFVSMSVGGQEDSQCKEKCVWGGVAIKGVEESWMEPYMWYCCPHQAQKIRKTAHNLLVVTPFNHAMYTEFKIQYRIAPETNVETTSTTKATTKSSTKATTRSTTTKKPTTTTPAKNVKELKLGKYIFVSTQMSFAAAKAHCDGKGNYRLASVHRSGRDDYFARIFNWIDKRLGAIFWIGLHKPEGADSSYSWADGSPVDYTNWEDGMPGSYSMESCAAFMNEKWFPFECDWEQAFVCQQQ